jgi:hypothetical protein
MGTSFNAIALADAMSPHGGAACACEAEPTVARPAFIEA